MIYDKIDRTKYKILVKNYDCNFFLLGIPIIVNNRNELRESLFNFRFQKSLQQLEHPQKLRHVKRDIARVQTLIRELELEIR